MIRVYCTVTVLRKCINRVKDKDVVMFRKPLNVKGRIEEAEKDHNLKREEVSYRETY